MKNKIEPINPPKICRNFPDRPYKELHRDHLLDNINKMFEGSNVVVLTGEEGIGKTTLLAQYGLRYPDNTISCFINPYSKIGYSPDYVRLILAEQIHWIITKTLYDSGSIDPIKYNNHLHQLERMAINRRKPYIFLIDAIDDIPNEDKVFTDVILREILPIGQHWLKFLFTGDSSTDYSHIKDISQPWSIPPFSTPEVSEYFDDFNIKVSDLEEIRHMCRGIPGRLASVRRLLQTGQSVQNIMEWNPKSRLDFIKLEFDIVGSLSILQTNIISILAFSYSRFSSYNLANILGYDVVEIENAIDGCPMLNLESTTKIISFISNPHREYAASLYSNKSEWAIEKIIEYIKSQTDDTEKLTELPEYLKRANKYDELLNQLTHEHFANLVNQTQTISPLINQITLGLDASVSLSRYFSLFNFAILKSLSFELGGIESTYTEIEARLALNQIEEAILLANNAKLKEDQLRLFAFITRYCLEHELQIDDSIKTQIAILAKQIDFTTVESEAPAVAANLIWSDPDLAIDILEKATEKRDDVDSDFALFHLTMLTQAAKSPNYNTDHLLEKTASKIQDPKLQEFLSHANVFFGKCDASEVLNRLDGSEFKTKLFCLRTWAKAAYSCDNPETVLNYALDEILKNTAYLPKLKDLCDLANQLPNIVSIDDVKRLVTRFDSMIASVEQFGSSQDNTAVQLLLARAEIKYDFVACTNRLVKVFLEVTEVHELSIKVECLAMIKDALYEIDPSKIIENNEQIQSCIDEELQKSVTDLLNDCSDHFSILKPTIGILAARYPQMVMDIIKDINTKFRRDKAYFELAINMLEDPTFNLDFNIFWLIVTEYTADVTSWRILVRLFSAAISVNEISQIQLEELRRFANIIENIGAAATQCNAACLAYKLYKKHISEGQYSSLCKDLEALINESFKSIEPAWEQIEAGNQIAITLSSFESENARQYLEICKRMSNDVAIKSSKSVDIHIRILLLAIRSCPMLFTNGKDAEEQIALLDHLIGLIPSIGEQMALWGNLAMLGYACNKRDIADPIVKKYIFPNLENFNPKEKQYKAEIVKTIAPALYYYHPSTAIEQIENIITEEQDRALYQICDFIFTKTTWTEPYEIKPNKSFVLDYHEARNICDLLERTRGDSYVYSSLQHLVESIISKTNRYNFSDIQKGEIHKILTNITQNKFPDSENIKHEGYKILSEAQILRLAKSRKDDWKTLVERTQKIPSIADRVFIYPVIARCIPNIYSDLRNECVKNATTDIDRIPSDSNRIDRHIYLSEEIISFDEPTARMLLKNAMVVTISSDDSESMFTQQKRIIDRANSVSPIFAEEVANLFDCDPARMKARIDSLQEEPEKIKARYDLHEYLKMLKIKNDMLNKESNSEQTDYDPINYSEIAYRALASLNAGLINTFKLEETGYYLEIASKLPLSQAYPIYLWFIANLTKRTGATSKAMEMVEPIFKSLLAVSNFAHVVRKKTNDQFNQNRDTLTFGEMENEQSIIASDDFGKVNQYIREWLERELGEHLYICDPYFKPEDLEFVRMVASVDNECQIHIFTGDSNSSVPIAPNIKYRQAWKDISEIDPPPTEIVMVTLESGKPAFHDRFWLTSHAGLDFGSSLGAIGTQRISKITYISEQEYNFWIDKINPFIKRQRTRNGKIIKYYSFSLI